MKKALSSIFLTLFVVVTISSCLDDEFQLKNRWQLREYRYADGTVKKIDNVFYDFQQGSFMAICIDENVGNCRFRGTYILEKGELSIAIFDSDSKGNGGIYYDKFFKWTDENRTFQIEEMSSSKMRLNHEGTTSVFRKY